jgi:acetolactate synthase-1/2/3 large subunit
MAGGGETVADQIARAVAATGAGLAFGHPGGEVVVLMDALRRVGVEYVLAHHENAAAFMASGQGELTGVPGVAIATLGPGATNMVTGAASALLERAPVLLFTGALATTAPAGTTHQALDLNAVYAPVTKRSFALTAENAATSIAAAIRLTTTPPFGPVHLALPADVAASAASSAPARAAPDPEAAPDPPDPVALAEARRLLAGGRRPAIIVGLDALRGDAWQAVRRLAAGTGAVVAALPKAKGVFPEDDARFVGTLEMVGDEIVVEFLQSADVVVAAGADVVEFDKPWRVSAPLIQVDAVPTSPAYLRPVVALHGDVAGILEALAPASPATGWSDAEVAAHRERLEAFVRTQGEALQTWQVVRAVRRLLPAHAIAASDVGAHKMVVGQAWSTTLPGTFFMANGLSSMGYSVPLATAARLVRPDAPAVSFVGDGGLSMYLGELETLARLGIDILVVVFVDGSLELIRRAQKRRSVGYLGTSFGNPDFAALGRAFSISVTEVASAGELEAVLPMVVEQPGVRLLAARIDGNDYRF